MSQAQTGGATAHGPRVSRDAAPAQSTGFREARPTGRTVGREWIPVLLPSARGASRLGANLAGAGSGATTLDWLRPPHPNEAADAVTSLLASIVESAEDPIFSMNLAGRIRTWNDAAERIYGRPATDVIGESAGLLAARDQPDVLMGAIGQVAAGEHVAPLAVCHLDGAGRTIELTVTLAAIRDPWSQSIVGISAIARNVTDEGGRSAAGAARASQAERMETIGRLTSGVAHDFNNMLAAISGYAEIARLETDLAGVREAIDDIDHTARRAAAMTQQLLAFGRRRPEEPVPVDLNAVVTETLPLLQRVIGDRHRVETSIGDAPIVVVADQSKLEQVLLNLAVNGRDAMRASGVLTIAVSVVTLRKGYRAGGADARPGAYAALAVSDTGAGMSSAMCRQIFEPFFTTRASEGGTGLGLATVRRIVDELGGSIDVYSELNIGTTFSVLIPLAEEPPGLPA